MPHARIGAPLRVTLCIRALSVACSACSGCRTPSDNRMRPQSHPPPRKGAISLQACCRLAGCGPGSCHQRRPAWYPRRAAGCIRSRPSRRLPVLRGEERHLCQGVRPFVFRLQTGPCRPPSSVALKAVENFILGTGDGWMLLLGLSLPWDVCRIQRSMGDRRGGRKGRNAGLLQARSPPGPRGSKEHPQPLQFGCLGE